MCHIILKLLTCSFKVHKLPPFIVQASEGGPMGPKHVRRLDYLKFSSKACCTWQLYHTLTIITQSPNQQQDGASLQHLVVFISGHFPQKLGNQLIIQSSWQTI